MSLTDIFNSIVNYQITGSMVVDFAAPIIQVLIFAILPVIIGAIIFINLFIWIERQIPANKKEKWANAVGLGCVSLVFILPFIFSIFD